MSKNKKYDNNKRIAIVTGLSKELLEMQEMKKIYKTFEVFSKIIGSNGKNVKVLQVAGDISGEKSIPTINRRNCKKVWQNRRVGK
jgi:hypothetical protein